MSPASGGAAFAAFVANMATYTCVKQCCCSELNATKAGSTPPQKDGGRVAPGPRWVDGGGHPHPIPSDAGESWQVIPSPSAGSGVVA
eukprot:5021197-Amphidinium_carterae.1